MVKNSPEENKGSNETFQTFDPDAVNSVIKNVAVSVIGVYAAVTALNTARDLIVILATK